MDVMVLIFFAIIVAIFLMILAFRLGKTLFRIVSIGIAVVFFGSILIGILLVVVAVGFKDDFINDDNLFLLADDGDLIAGFILKPIKDRYKINLDDVLSGQLSITNSPYSVISEEDFESYIGFYENDNVDILAPMFANVILINSSFFNDSLNDYVELGFMNLKVFEILDILKSNNSEVAFNQMVNQNYNFSVNTSVFGRNDVEISGSLFYFFFNDKMKKDQLSIITGFHERTMVVVPESALIKFFRIVPRNVIESLIASVTKEG